MDVLLSDDELTDDAIDAMLRELGHIGLGSSPNGPLTGECSHAIVFLISLFSYKVLFYYFIPGTLPTGLPTGTNLLPDACLCADGYTSNVRLFNDAHAWA